jgi:hypothetical protein
MFIRLVEDLSLIFIGIEIFGVFLLLVSVLIIFHAVFCLLSDCDTSLL